MPDMTAGMVRGHPARRWVPDRDKYVHVNTAQPAGQALTANKAYYYPFEIDETQVLSNVHIAIGTQSGNLDVGIYDSAGNRLVSSGSTAVAAAGEQVIALSLTLPRGRYYVAFAFDNGTATIQAAVPGTTAMAVMLGCKEQATAFPLPATATFATLSLQAMLQLGLELA